MRSEPFGSFARRLTLGYAVLAVLLILVAAGVSTLLACVFYVGSLNEAAAASIQKAAALAGQYQSEGMALPQYAQQIVDDLNRSHVHVFIVDESQQLLAGSMRGAMPTRQTHAIAALFGLRPRFAHVPGGTIVVMPDLADFSWLLARYLAVVASVGLAATLLAWFVGRRITARAIAPLADVTRALRRIAGGDFAPEPLLEVNVELRDLTAAYNEVAYRLTAATAERERNQLQMRQFVADAGHELRTPLTVVMGYLEMLQQHAVSDPAGVERIHATMLAESRRMRTVIEKLIFLARLDRPAAPRVARIDAAEMAARVIAALEPIAGTGRVTLAADGPAVLEGDENELYEALKNVVENAVRYAPESPVRVAVTRQDAAVRIEVSDNGPGMTDDDVAHAFDRFYRGSARSASGEPIEGSGLGLAIAKLAVERAGGSIAIESTDAKGTRVALTLPAR